ncbi:MAG: response regulator transcription factor [Lachnospiraceae bacterium]|nr:response regulator transcription factor [Lachnospiraceae bacterium]
MHYNCLIVDDEVELAKMTAEYFEMFDIKTQYVDSAVSCFDFLKENETDMILLDINLQDGSGFEVCRKIREDYQLPILFISARQSDDDVLVALSIGGDDYVKKPYSLSVLLAKVKVNLKRVEQIKKLSGEGNAAGAKADLSIAKTSVIEAGVADMSVATVQNTDQSASEEILHLDAPTMSVIINGKRISLKAKEFALLKALYDHKNTIVTKDQLFEEVWGDSFYGDGTLNVHIRKLREKMEQDPNNPEYIKTVWGTGYILEVK